MGRPRKPTALKILEGDQPCRINLDEPAAPAGAGPCPDFLDEVGRGAWHRIARQLDRLGVLTVADGEALALYASIFSQWDRARAALDREGLTVTTTTTTETTNRTTYREVTKTHPMVAVAAECQRQMMRLLGQFGMTPSARSSLHVQGQAEVDPLLAFLESKGKKKA